MLLRLPWADCFPCSCEETGGNAAPASLLQQGKGRWNRHSYSSRGANTISHKSGESPTPGYQNQTSCPAFAPHTYFCDQGLGQALDTDSDKNLCKEKFKQNNLVPDARLRGAGGM